MFDDLLSQATDLKARGEPFALATVVACKPPTSAKPGAKAIVRADGAFIGWVGGSCAQPVVTAEAQKALRDGSPRLIRLTPDPSGDPGGAWPNVYDVVMSCQSEGSLEIFIEPHLPRPQLVLIGGSPMARALAHLGHFMGFAVTVSDPQATRESFPDADAVVPVLEELPGRVAPGASVVVATMGHYDEEALAAALTYPAGYVALIASEKRGKAVLESVREDGASEDAIGRVRFPAGIRIGAVQPEEIALSIMAEIIQLRAQGAIAARQAPPPPEAGQATEAIDPVCGMTVVIARARHTAVHDGATVYFCCPSCKKSFLRDPAAYALARP